MKLKTAMVAALLGMMTFVGSAFTLDAVGYEGNLLAQDPFSVFVPGYGEIVFEDGPDSSLVVSSAFENENCADGPSLCFDPNESVKLIFGEVKPSNGGSEFGGQSADEPVLAEKAPFGLKPILGVYRSASHGAALHAVNRNAIPEAASVTLGLLGCLLWMLRRRS